MDRDFYIFSDIDSTFEGTAESFKEFNYAVRRLEEEVGPVKIYFTSGTTSFDFVHRMSWLEKNAPEIHNRVAGAVLGDGFMRKNDDVPIAIKAAYKEHPKVKACDFLLGFIKPNNISGIIYMGDDREDVKGMNFLKNFDKYFPFGIHTIMPANSKFDRMQGGVDFYSHKRRIDGCTEGIYHIADRIEEMIDDYCL